AAPPPREEKFNRPVVPEFGTGRPFLLPNHTAGLVAGDEMRLRAEALQLAAQQRHRGLAIEKHRELQARRAGIQHQDCVGHDVTSLGLCRCAARWWTRSWKSPSPPPTGWRPWAARCQGCGPTRWRSARYRPSPPV